MRALDTLTHTLGLTTHQDPGATARDGKWEETVSREEGGLRGPRGGEDGVHMEEAEWWGPRERGSKAWRQSITSQTLPKQRPPHPHTHPTYFPGCLLQRGDRIPSCCCDRQGHSLPGKSGLGCLGRR